jgi:ADP-heptose:LPS heptosyltransferase
VECNEVERNFEFVRKLGYRGDAIEVNSRVWLSESDRRRAAEILNKYGLKKKEFVLLCPGARQLQRLWPVTKWRELVRFLLTSTSRKVVFCGDVCDRLIIDDIVEPFDHESRIINLAGLLSLNEFAGIINNAELLIGVDSGPIHIAAALKIPNICIAGGGHGRRFYPYGDLRMNRIVYKQLDCFGCNWHCKYNKAKCIDMNTVTDVVREISFLREHQGFAF